MMGSSRIHGACQSNVKFVTSCPTLPRNVSDFFGTDRAWTSPFPRFEEIRERGHPARLSRRNCTRRNCAALWHVCPHERSARETP